jgi:hypothetical protein
MRRRQLLGGWVACAALALALSACGGSSNGPLSRAELAARVNDACRTYVKASTAIPQPADFTTNPAAAAAYLKKLQPLVESEHAAIAKLKPVAALKAQFAQFQTASGHQLALFEDALVKARASDRTGVRDLVDAARYKQAVLVPIERSLGFTACER